MQGSSGDKEAAGQGPHPGTGEFPSGSPEYLKQSDPSIPRYAPGRTPRPPRTTCTFASEQILPLLAAFSKEIEGVRNGTDVEHLHRMRVASRRIRAALRTFRLCFPQKKYARFLSETRDITRALGQARDADVQAAFLKKARKRLSAGRQDTPDDRRDQVVQARREAIDYLLAKVRSERAGYQKTVLRSLERFERQEQPDAIRTALLPPRASGHRQQGPPGYGTLTFLAAEYIGQGIVDLCTYEPWLHHPDAVTEHHAMRIAAKHLRYTMEIFSPLYRLGLKRYIARAARLQQLLGDLHDTDVWIDTVTLMLLQERSRPKSLADPHRPGPAVIRGLKLFLQDRERDRVKLFRQTVRYWNRLQRSGLFGDLAREISGNYKVQYRAHPEIPEEERRRLIWQFSQVYPKGVPHSLQVTRLALQVFDHLQAVHHLSRRERLLLEYGAALHDIGWRSGRRGHAKRSARLVHAAEHLPLSREERGIIGCLASSHRGKGRFESSGYYRLLPEGEQRVIRILAGILRVADGLDGFHRARASSLRCEVVPDAVVCTIFSSADCSDEISLAGEKSDLLEEALGIPFEFVQDLPGPPLPDTGTGMVQQESLSGPGEEYFQGSSVSIRK